MITEEHILELARQQSFDRGKNYYLSGAIFDQRHQENILTAYCEGSQMEPYQVKVALGEEGIKYTRCSCPYDWGGICKHIVALLLQWINEPDSFEVVPPIEKLLNNLSKEELMEIIKEMVDREPDLLSIIEVSKASQSPQIDLSIFRRMIDRALGGYGLIDIAETLADVQASADKLLRRQAYFNAAEVYSLILKQMSLEGLEILGYDEGDICIVLDECAEGIVQCLRQGEPDKETRLEWLETLLDAVIADIEIGGIELAPAAYEALMEFVTDEDEEWFMAKIEEKSPESLSRWRKESLNSLVANWLNARGREKEADEYILEVGTPEQKAFKLIEVGRFDEAVKIAQAHFESLPGLVNRFADVLLEAGEDSRAVEFVDSMHEPDSRSLREWQERYYQKHGNWEKVLEYRMKGFKAYPSMHSYEQVKEIAQKVGNWNTLRSETYEFLKESSPGLMLRIALDEDELPLVLELVEKIEQVPMNLLEEIAENAEENHPEKALELYERVVNALISRRNQDAYRKSVEIVDQIRTIYQRLETEKAVEDTEENYTEKTLELYEKVVDVLISKDDRYACKEAVKLMDQMQTIYQKFEDEEAVENAEKDSLKLYKEIIKVLIARKRREAYREAVKLMNQIRAIYQKLDVESEWKTYIESIYSEYPGYKALHEVMDKGLSKMKHSR